MSKECGPSGDEGSGDSLTTKRQRPGWTSFGYVRSLDLRAAAYCPRGVVLRSLAGEGGNDGGVNGQLASSPKSAYLLSELLEVGATYRHSTARTLDSTNFKVVPGWKTSDGSTTFSLGVEACEPYPEHRGLITISSLFNPIFSLFFFGDFFLK